MKLKKLPLSKFPPINVRYISFRTSPTMIKGNSLDNFRVRTLFLIITYELLYAVWYHLYSLKNVKNTYGGALLLAKPVTPNTPPWVFFTFFKLYK